jgi:hypothetical protein
VVRHYEILQLKPGASPPEIQQAYRDLVRVWHPDRFAHDPRLQKIAELRMKEINTAYIALGKLQREAPLVEETTLDRRISPHSWKILQPSVRALWLAVLLIAVSVAVMRLYAFWNGPKHELVSIGKETRQHIALWAGPNLADAFYGSNGIVPQSMDRFVGFYEATAPLTGATSRSPERPPESHSNPIRRRVSGWGLAKFRCTIAPTKTSLSS